MKTKQFIGLSPREAGILKALVKANGSYVEAAALSCIAVTTLKTHLQNASNKLHTTSALSLLIEAVKQGYVESKDFYD